MTDMSEQPQDSLVRIETPTEIATSDTDYIGEKTQPTEEILNALNALQQTAAAQNGHEQPQSQQDSQSQEAPSEWHVLREKLREHPHDPDAWNKLVDLAEARGDIEQIKQTYEALLEVYPNTVCIFKPSTQRSLTHISQYQVVCSNCLSQPFPEPRPLPVC
jgi:cleavage stimulation factor subunit 3